jgi:peptidyl-prolyl cis-trans isomerase D
MRHPGRDDAVPPALVAKLFAAKPGEVVTGSDGTGSYVAQLDEVQKPEDISQSATATLSRDIAAGQQADLGQEFTQALRARFPVEIHREVLDKLF